MKNYSKYLFVFIFSVIFLTGCFNANNNININTTLNTENKDLMFVRDGQIYIADIDGNEEINVSDNNKYNFSPLWLEQGNKILYIVKQEQDQDDYFGVWRKNIKNSEIDLLWGSKEKPDFISISPEKQWLVYAESSGCYLFDIEEKQATRFSDNCEQISWLPKDKKFIYTQNNILYLLEFNIKKELSEPKELFKGEIGSPIFIDKKTIVFETQDFNINKDDKSDEENIEYADTYDIYELDLEDDSLNALTNLNFVKTEEIYLEMSPDNNDLLYSRLNASISMPEVWLINLNKQNIAKKVLESAQNVVWSADGESLYYEIWKRDEKQGVIKEIYRASKDGLNKKSIIANAESPTFYHNTKSKNNL